jgi:LacI family transcriptional regulator
VSAGGRRRATISQVAEEAGVARSTVSRAFTRPERLSPDTVERVLAVAERLGYTPNPVAQALSTGQSRNIGLIVPDVANPFFPPLIRAAQRKAEDYDYCIFLGDSDEKPEREDKLVDRFTHQVAGLILVSSRLSEARIREHARRRPLVLINQDVPEMLRVLINSGAGVAQAIRHLAELGHRHVVYVSGPTTSWANRQRRSALRQAARQHGMEVSAVSAHKSTHETGRAAVGAILATGATAAFAFDDLLAQGVLAGLHDAGISVPGQFSVIGCDDVLGATTYPPLTTVSNRCIEVAEIAVTLLMDALKSRASSDVRHVLDTHLVIRETTAPPASAGPRSSRRRAVPGDAG